MEFSKRSKLTSMSIRAKLVLIIILLVVLSITATKVYDYTTRVTEIERTVREENLNKATITASRLETEMARTVSTLETAANNPAFASDDKDTIIKALLSVKEQNPIFSTVFIADSSLKKLNEKGETSSLASREYMQEVKKTKKTVISREILISQATQKPSIMITTPVTVVGAPERYLGISINIDKLQNIIDKTKISDSNYSFAFDGKDGLVFAHPIKEYIGSLKLINPDEKDKQKTASELQEMAKQAVSGQSGTQIYNFDGAKIIAAYVSIPGTSFGVATRMNYEDAMAPIRQERNSAIIIVLITSLISVAIGSVFAKYIAAPIKSIANQANIIASGDFTKAIDLTVHGKDEVAQLQNNFKEMAIMLKSSMTQIRQAVTEITSSSEVLEGNSEQSAQSATQVAQTVAEVASGTIAQVNAVNRTVEIVKGIGNQIDEISKNASEATLLTKDSAAAASDGGKAVNHAVESITNINAIVQDTAKAIRELGTSSEQISHIVDAISGLASQTNLLALNAAIEAARAGEQGRGFAVVAEEVRRLAEQSQESASNIAQIIGEVQLQTKYVIEKMDKSAEEVSAGQNVVLATGESFKTIQAQIENVNHSVQGIAVIIQQLTKSSSNVLSSVEEIREISQDTAANSQTISAATEEQSASMQEVASSAEALAQLSDKLEGTLNQYKF
ncbi:MAG: methyl-accepting chemotaxis protein [Phycisphaerales bacterium]